MRIFTKIGALSNAEFKTELDKHTDGIVSEAMGVGYPRAECLAWLSKLRNRLDQGDELTVQENLDLQELLLVLEKEVREDGVISPQQWKDKKGGGFFSFLRPTIYRKP